MRMLTLAMILGLIASVIALAELARKTKLPYPTLMVVGGLLIGFIPGLPAPALDPKLIFLGVLPPILYAAAWSTWLQDFRRHLTSISLLAVGLVLVTAFAVALAAKYVIGMPWWVGFLLGAIVSPPDAAAATAICQRLGVDRRIVTVLEGESLVNDASGLTMYHVALGAVVAGQFSGLEAGRELVVSTIGGIAMGLGIGWAIARAHKVLREPVVTTAVSLLAPYCAYLPAEHFHVSGVLATVAAGLFVSRRSPRIFSPAARIQAVNVWELLILLINGLVFVLIGLQLKGLVEATHAYSPLTLAGYALCISLVVMVVRLAWVFPMARLSRVLTPRRWREPPATWQQLSVIGWTGMRGIVSLAAAMAIPQFTETVPTTLVPFRDLIILLTFAVIFATLVVQSLTLPPLIRFFGESVAEVLEHEELVARLLATNAALRHLESASQASTPAVERVRADYLERIELASAEIRGDLAKPARGRAKPEDDVRLAALAAERVEIISLRDRGEISEEVFRRIERDLDLEESRLL